MSRPAGEPAAHASLKRGLAFLRMNVTGHGASRSPMVVGNTLAELDRLLRILIVEAARDRGIGLSARARSNADRLTLLCGAHLDERRMRALLRSATCLRRHAGRAHHADRRGVPFMTVGWSISASNTTSLHRVRLGASVIPSAEQIDDVCAFYDRLAHRIVAGRGAVRPAIPPHGLALEAA